MVPAMKESRTATVREARLVLAPVGVRCRLCKLTAADKYGAVVQIEVMYGGKRYGDEGNELTPLWRRSWVCEPCIDALATIRDALDLLDFREVDDLPGANAREAEGR